MENERKGTTGYGPFFTMGNSKEVQEEFPFVNNIYDSYGVKVHRFFLTRCLFL